MITSTRFIDTAREGYSCKIEWDLAKEQRKNSQKLNEYFTACTTLPTLGVIAAGGSAYIYDGQTVDLIGLNNVKMAHVPRVFRPHVLKNHTGFSKNVFYKQKPDIVAVAESFTKINEKNIFKYDPFVIKTLDSVMYERRFQQEYSKAIIRKRDAAEQYVAYMSNRFLDNLETSTYEVQRLPW